MGATFQSALGLALIPFVAWVFSERRFDFTSRQIISILMAGLGVQILIAGLLLNTPGREQAFLAISGAVVGLQNATLEGVRMVFGYLAGGPPPFALDHPENSFLLGFQALPLILVMSVLSRLLYHWGLLQRVVQVFAFLLRRTMGVGGALGTASAANIFVGMVEAPLLIRPFLASLSRSDLFAVMTVGMATVAGTVMALYASLLEASLPGAAGHILTASIISAPAALMVARLMVPEDGAQDDGDKTSLAMVASDTDSVMDAIAKGTTDGLRLLVLVAAMLVVMVSLVALANKILGAAVEPLGLDLTVEQLLGYALAPAAWVIGIPWTEAVVSGQLIGVKVVLNEFLAYLRLAEVPAGQLSERSRTILTYALCGFANFGSLGIMAGGLIAMAPDRRTEILTLGPRTIFSGLLATLLTGAVVGLFTAP